jgi:murein DD-endopeptidase MepM/ murein hydrolase activator NlpD
MGIQRMRRIATPKRVGMLVLVAMMALPAVPADAYHSQRKQELDRLISENQAKVEAAKKAERTLVSQINDSDKRRELLETQVKIAEAELGKAREELARIANRLAKLDAQVEAKTVELEGMLGDLYTQQQIMSDRVADFYMNAPTQLAVTAGAVDIGDLIDIQNFAISVMESDREIGAKLLEQKDAVAERRAEIQAAQEEVAAHHARQEQVTQRLAHARERRASAVAAVQEEIQTKESLLGKVKERRAEYERIIRSYERESAKIESFLRSQGSTSTGGAIRGKGGYLVWPVSGRITSPYGWRTHPIYKSRAFHTGIDIGAGSGVPIDSARSGRVIDAGYKGAYGLAVVVDHGEGIATLYAHMSSISVSTGQQVSTGQMVGRVGSTGYSTGPHLHFEVRVNGQHTNPMQWL